MGCGCNKGRKQVMGNFVEATYIAGTNMADLFDAAVGCEPYHGAFQATHFHIVGAGTEAEKLFLRNNRDFAIAYSKEHGNLPITNLVNATSLCHDRLVALLGA